MKLFENQLWSRRPKYLLWSSSFLHVVKVEPVFYSTRQKVLKRRNRHVDVHFVNLTISRRELPTFLWPRETVTDLLETIRFDARVLSDTPLILHWKITQFSNYSPKWTMMSYRRRLWRRIVDGKDSERNWVLKLNWIIWMVSDWNVVLSNIHDLLNFLLPPPQ